jgi:hypothetical protein
VYTANVLLLPIYALPYINIGAWGVPAKISRIENNKNLGNFSNRN